jgi:hypothetical protein
MPTIADLVDRIQDEIAGAAFKSQIESAVARAVDHYSVEPWWFLEHESTTSTTADGETVTLPSDYEDIRIVTATVNGYREFLRPQSYDWYINRQRTATASGEPSYYSIFGETCYLWPTPDQVYTITFSYIRKLSAAMAADNEWSDTAGYLIGYRAKWDLYLNTNQDFELASAMKAAEMDAYARLRRRSANRRSAPNSVVLYH